MSSYTNQSNWSRSSGASASEMPSSDSFSVGTSVFSSRATATEVVTVPEKVLDQVKAWISKEWTPAIQDLATYMDQAKTPSGRGRYHEKLPSQRKSLHACLEAGLGEKTACGGSTTPNCLKTLAAIIHVAGEQELYDRESRKSWGSRAELLGSIQCESYGPENTITVRTKKQAVTKALKELSFLLKNSRELDSAIGSLVRDRERSAGDQYSTFFELDTSRTKYASRKKCFHDDRQFRPTFLPPGKRLSRIRLHQSCQPRRHRRVLL